MGNRSAESSSDKLQRKLAKVERLRLRLLTLCAVQVVLAVIFGVYVLVEAEDVSAVRERSVIVSYQATLAFVWALVGLLGLFAATVRRLQSLALFCTLEIFSTLLSASVNAVLLLLYHLQCQALATDALRDPSLGPSWLRCEESAVGLGFSSALLLFLGLTAAAALELRFRIQKTGKRSLNWNVKPQRWKERNIRRGASAALRALTKNEAGEDVAALRAERVAWVAPELATPPGRLGLATVGSGRCSALWRSSCAAQSPIGGCGAAPSLGQRAAEPEPLSGHPGGRGQPAQVPGQHARRAVHRALAAAPLPHDRARRAAAAPAQPAQGLPQAGRVVRGQGLPLACARCGSNPNAPAPAAPHTPAAHRRTAAPPRRLSCAPARARRPAHAALPTPPCPRRRRGAERGPRRAHGGRGGGPRG